MEEIWAYVGANLPALVAAGAAVVAATVSLVVTGQQRRHSSKEWLRARRADVYGEFVASQMEIGRLLFDADSSRDKAESEQIQARLDDAHKRASEVIGQMLMLGGPKVKMLVQHYNTNVQRSFDQASKPEFRDAMDFLTSTTEILNYYMSRELSAPTVVPDRKHKRVVRQLEQAVQDGARGRRERREKKLREYQQLVDQASEQLDEQTAMSS